MGRLTKQTKAAITKKALQMDKDNLPSYHIADESKFITQEKIDILNHPAKYKDWIGAKDGGKTRPVILREIGLMEENPDAYGLSLKKYKSGAVGRLHTAVNNITLELKFAGYKMYDYEKGMNQTYRLFNRKQKSKNQTIEYSSFDDANGLAGIEAPNLGYFPLVHLEEIVLIDDPGQLPTKKEWKASLKTVEDSVDRSNRRYRKRTGKNIPDTQYHATMNAWDDHPVIENAEKYFPEKDFLDWVLLDIDNNHTKAVYVKSQNRLIIRMTKFANPEIENREELKAQCLKAVADKDSYELARLLGLKYEGSETSHKTWDMSRVVTGDTREMLKSADRLNSIVVAWDIDHRRQLVATPVYHVKKLLNASTAVENILVGEQRVIRTNGEGTNGSMIPIYQEQMKVINKEIMHEAMLLRNSTKNPKLSFLYMDDDKSQYLLQMTDQVKHFSGLGKAKKHGDWGIPERTDNIQLGLDLGAYVIDEKNVTLLNKMKNSIIKEGSTKRDESGKLEKDYDEINSMEYGLYLTRYMIHKPQIQWGMISHYYKKEGQ